MITETQSKSAEQERPSSTLKETSSLLYPSSERQIWKTSLENNKFSKEVSKTVLWNHCFSRLFCFWGNQNNWNLFKKHASCTQPKALSEDSDHSGCSGRVCFMNAGSAKHHRVDDITAQSSGWDGVWALGLELHKMLLVSVLSLSYFQLNRYSYQTPMCSLPCQTIYMHHSHLKGH